MRARDRGQHHGQNLRAGQGGADQHGSIRLRRRHHDSTPARHQVTCEDARQVGDRRAAHLASKSWLAAEPRPS